ncbi:hypothetical protein D3C81_1978980 [compost metagenome]
MQLFGGFCQALCRPVDRFTIMRLQHRKTRSQSNPAIARTLVIPCAKLRQTIIQHVANGDEIAKRFRHLLPFYLQEAIVHPDAGHSLGAKRAA